MCLDILDVLVEFKTAWCGIVVIMVKVVAVYYSRTGITALVVESLKSALRSVNIDTDVYRVLPAEEYSRPLHLNLRLAYETLVKRGADIKFEPEKPKIENYRAVVVASPIWFGTLAPPVQEFLKNHYTALKPLVVVTTSTLTSNCSKIEEVVEELCGAKPVFCININAAKVKDGANLKQAINEVAKVIESLKVQ